jgi:hypothetical protein
VQTPVDKEEAIIKEEGIDIAELFMKVLDPKKYKHGDIKDTPNEVKFNTFKWLNADRMRTEEEHNRIEL